MPTINLHETKDTITIRSNKPEFTFSTIEGEEWLMSLSPEPCSTDPSIRRVTPVINKEAFIKCYNKWIKNEEE